MASPKCPLLVRCTVKDVPRKGQLHTLLDPFPIAVVYFLASEKRTTSQQRTYENDWSQSALY